MSDEDDLDFIVDLIKTCLPEQRTDVIREECEKYFKGEGKNDTTQA